MKPSKEHALALLSQSLASAGIELDDAMTKRAKFLGNKLTIDLKSDDFESDTLATAFLQAFRVTVVVTKAGEDSVDGKVSVEVMKPEVYSGDAPFQLTESQRLELKPMNRYKRAL